MLESARSLRQRRGTKDEVDKNQEKTGSLMEAEKKCLKGESYALGHYRGMLIWLVNDWPRCLGLVPDWSDDCWTSIRHTHTDTHTIQECRHTSDTYARADTGMNSRSHINWEVWKLVWTHTFSLEHRFFLTCVVCVFGLPAGQNESTCHDLLSVFEHAWFPYSLVSESLGEDQIGFGTLWFRAPARLPMWFVCSWVFSIETPQKL